MTGKDDPGVGDRGCVSLRETDQINSKLDRSSNRNITRRISTSHTLSLFLNTLTLINYYQGEIPETMCCNQRRCGWLPMETYKTN